MEQSQLPTDWDAERVRRALEHYELQTDDEALAEDEAAFAERRETIMEVPENFYRPFAS